MKSWSKNFVILAVVTPALFWVSNSSVAQVDQESTPEVSVDFVKEIQQIFSNHCFSCHGPSKQESNYRLDVKKRALGKADFGEKTIIPGDGKNSPLLEYISGSDPDMLMPPEGEGKSLSQEQVDLIERWIDEGANWPAEAAGANEKALTTDLWSLKPVVKHRIPLVGKEQPENFLLSNGIDNFIADKLHRRGLSHSSPADKVTLIRRIYLDMHGLLPSAEQVKSFVEDDSNQAYEKIVDEVLDSKHYGERWARHWLDVVRFGESTGYEVNRDRANAYHYRDYVIHSLNEDKSYKDFVVEQLAGDAVGVDEATGFLVGGAYDIVKSPDVNLTLAQRQDELADYVSTTSTAFLGLTVGCARCHNHKFDPILQRDYYALQAVFAGVEHGERKLLSQVPISDRDTLSRKRTELASLLQQFDELRKDATLIPPRKSKALRPNVNAQKNVEDFEPIESKFLRFTILQTNSSEPCLDELEIYEHGSATTSTNVALAESGSKATSSGDFPNNPKHVLEHINDGKHGNNFSWISSTQGTGWVQIEFAEIKKIDRVVWGRDRTGTFSDRLATEYTIKVSRDAKNWTEVSSSKTREPYLPNGKDPEDAFIDRLPNELASKAKGLYSKIKSLRTEIPELEKAIPMGYVGKFKRPATTYRLYRGDPMAPREEVPPDVLTVMGSLKLDSKTPEQKRRLILARWIASDDNPLTARVIVNRVWQYHFGRGIVPTPSDFGKNGVPPSHPELLDWLAARFMENGWSLKWLHREILMSSTYRQSSHPRREALSKDADCKYLWRFPPRRLEAAAIRDCILQVSGKLNPKAGGPGFLLFEIDRENVHHYFPLETFGPEHFRRMIYMTKIRQEQDEVFGTFDCPDGGQTIPERSRSTTALQALNLLNSKFMLEQADYLAKRLVEDTGPRVEDQVKLAFELAFLRQPAPSELEDSLRLIEAHGLSAFCRALLNANEFLFMS